MKQIIVKIKSLCQKEKEITGEIIRCLQDIYDQKIYLDMGYGSLFSFCTDELGQSPSAAQRKCDAVRVSRFVPDLPQKIEKGEMSLSKVSQVSKFMRQERKYAGKTFKKSEVKNLVAQVQKSKNEYEAAKTLSLKSEIKIQPIEEKAKVLPGGKQSLQIEVDDEVLRLLERVAQLTSHKGSRSKGALVKEALQFYLQKKDPCQKGQKDIKIQEEMPLDTMSLVPVKQTMPGGSRGASRGRSRYIPQKVRHLVWQKAQGKCTYRDPRTGNHCHSTFRLQIEHKTPFAQGGSHSPENLTLFCAAHNLRAAEKLGLLGSSFHREMSWG